jgi:Tfp pilus assembly protein PilX
MKSEKGMVLVVGLMVVLALSILALGAMKTTTTELKLTAIDRANKEAFYTAEAGIEEVRARLVSSTSAFPILDNQSSNSGWIAYVGPQEKCTSFGFDPINSSHVRYDTLNSSLDYAVSVSHKLNSSGQILKWGDNNNDGRIEENTTVGDNIFMATSRGYGSLGSKKMIKAEFSKIPRINVLSALYTKQVTRILGSSVVVTGSDKCGGTDVGGLITRVYSDSSGHPTIEGNPPLIESSLYDVDIQSMVDHFKKYATHSYNWEGNHSDVHWGSPTPGPDPQSPTSCDGHEVVYINTNPSSVKLTGGSSGCGLLLVNGNLEVEGGFSWYGLVLATGSITFLGGGEKNVTGAVMSGGTTATDTVGGNINIIYCSEAINRITDHMPLELLRWAEL